MSVSDAVGGRVCLVWQGACLVVLLFCLTPLQRHSDDKTLKICLRALHVVVALLVDVVMLVSTR
jgi:hypothetical protein